METRLVAALTAHPKNLEIYGPDPPTITFIESIRSLGVLQPIIVTYDNRVLSGHRRWKGAEAAGLESMLVTVFPSTDETDILEALVHANKHRTKTNEVLGREADMLLEIERKRATLRQQQTQLDGGDSEGKPRKKPVVENFPPPGICDDDQVGDQGKARDKVGEVLGVSGKTAEKAATVVRRIDELELEGKGEEAESLRETLNEKSVSAAYKATVNGDMKPTILCNKCERFGAKSGCTFCATLRRENKDKKEPKSKPPRPTEEILDPHGVTIPKRCRDAWGDPWIGITLELLEGVSEQVRMAFIADGMHKRSKHYPFFNEKDVADGSGFIIQYLDQLIEHFKKNRPHAVCPTCDGAGCGSCLMAGLVPEEVYAKLKGGEK